MIGRNHISITREGGFYLIVLAFVFSGALLRDINLLIAVAGVMVGLFLLNGLVAILTLRRVSFHRKLPEGVSAGDLLVADVTLSNHRRWLGSWAVIVEDHIQREHSSPREHASGRILFPYVAQRGSERVAYRGRLTRRGRYQFGPIVATTRYPFGLVSRTITVDEPARLTVVPRLGQLTPLWFTPKSTRHVGSQRSRHQQGSMEGEYHGLRDWRSGDSRSWIHWRTTAKRDQLTVRQFERNENQDLTLLVELWQPETSLGQLSERVELAVSFVATIVEGQCRRGSSRLQVGAAGRDVASVTGFSSMVTLREVMELLATAEADSADRLPELLDIALSDSRLHNRIVIVSTRHTDLTDTDRFESVWDNLNKRRTLGRITCFDVSGNDIDKYFQLQ